MKNIFRKKTAYLLIAANVLGVIACKDQFLDVPVTGQLSEAQVNSLKGTEAFLIGGLRPTQRPGRLARGGHQLALGQHPRR
jgi:hypothetical protein